MQEVAKKRYPAEGVKMPPHNLEAEQSVLAGILINNEALNDVIEILSPDDFYKESHRHLFEAMIGLYEEDSPIDMITVSEHLKRNKLLDKAGGVDYLASLIDAVSTSAGITYHARIVRDLSIKRHLIRQCSEISDRCFQEWEETDILLDMAEQSIYEIAEKKVREGFSSSDEVIKLSFGRIEDISKQEGFITGIPTGFKDFDSLTAGLQPSDLIVIAGRPSMGKTAFALNIAYNASVETGKAVAIFSLEMSRMQLGIRLLGMDAEIDSKRLRTGFLGNKEWRRLVDSAGRLSEIPLFIDDTSGISVLEMKAKCRRLARRHELGLVVVDYLQLIQGRVQYQSREREISEISRSLKAMAKDLNVPVIAVSQLNRKVEDRNIKRPLLSDLRESGAIEQDADVIVFLYRDDRKKGMEETGEYENIIKIEIAKQRNGPTGILSLLFQKEYTKFRDYTERYNEEPF